MTKVNYTAQPFSPNDKPADFQSFDPAHDVKKVGDAYFFSTDSLSDTEHQIDKLPKLIWQDYSQFTEGAIARTARMYERAFASMNRSEIVPDGWDIAKTAALGGLIGVVPYFFAPKIGEHLGFDQHLNEMFTHIASITAVIGGMHAATEFAHNYENEHANEETKEMLTQARNQAKKAQVAVMEWREQTNDPMAVELEAQLDATIQSYEQAFKETEKSMEHNPWWKVSGAAVLGGLAGAAPGAIAYAVCEKFFSDEQEPLLKSLSFAVAGAGLMAGSHAMTEIMRPQHVNMTSQETADELANARNLVRKSYADAVTFRRKLKAEEQHQQPSTESPEMAFNRAALEQIFTKEADKSKIPSLEIDTFAAEHQGELSPKLPTIAVAH